MKEDRHIQQNLVLRPVEVSHLEEYDALLRYVFQVDIDDIEESGYEEGELRQAKRPILKRSDVIGWFNNDKLISSLSIYPCKVNIFGKIYDMAGVTGVGTYPEYSNKGLMQELVLEAIYKMRQNKQWISYLFPFSIPFYRKKGWEIISDHMTFTINDTQLPKNMDTVGHVERREIDDPDVYDTYNRFALENHGALIRNSWDWEEYWRWENEEERIAAIYYDLDNKPMGYIFYWIKNDIFHIKDMIYLTQEAHRGLWDFISAHFSMVEQVKGHTYKNEPIAFLLEDSDIEETIKPYYMARIIDVEQFLLRYPFDETDVPLSFEVEDDLATWNSGIFSITWDKNEQIQVTRERLEGVVPTKITIQTLTSMLMGYRRPTYFQKIERIHVDTETLAQLEDVIPRSQPYFSDYF